jgi:hypothetical protein
MNNSPRHCLFVAPRVLGSLMDDKQVDDFVERHNLFVDVSLPKQFRGSVHINIEINGFDPE